MIYDENPDSALRALADHGFQEAQRALRLAEDELTAIGAVGDIETLEFDIQALAEITAALDAARERTRRLVRTRELRRRLLLQRNKTAAPK